MRRQYKSRTDEEPINACSLASQWESQCHSMRRSSTLAHPHSSSATNGTDGADCKCEPRSYLLAAACALCRKEKPPSRGEWFEGCTPPHSFNILSFPNILKLPEEIRADIKLLKDLKPPFHFCEPPRHSPSRPSSSEATIISTASTSTVSSFSRSTTAFSHSSTSSFPLTDESVSITGASSITNSSSTSTSSCVTTTADVPTSSTSTASQPDVPTSFTISAPTKTKIPHISTDGSNSSVPDVHILPSTTLDTPSLSFSLIPSKTAPAKVDQLIVSANATQTVSTATSSSFSWLSTDMPVTFTSIWVPPTSIPFTWTASSSTTVINSLPSASSWSTSSSLTTRATTTWTIPSSPPSGQPLETSESVGLQSTLSSTSTTTSASPGVNVSNPSSSLSTHWKIAGSVIGAVIGGSVFFAVILVLRHRRRRQQSASSAVYSRMSDGYDGTGQYGSPRRGGMGLPTMAEMTPAMTPHPLSASGALEVDRLLMNGGLSPRASQTDLTSEGDAFFQARPPMPPIHTDGGDYYNSSKNVTAVSLQPSRLSIPESYYNPETEPCSPAAESSVMWHSPVETFEDQQSDSRHSAQSQSSYSPHSAGSGSQHRRRQSSLLAAAMTRALESVPERPIR